MGLWLEQPLLLGDVLLEDVRLQGAVQHPWVDARPLRRDDVHAEDGDGRAADRHRRADLVQRYVLEQDLHVGGRVDGHPTVTNLTKAQRLIGVTAHQGRHVERDAKATAAAVQDHLVPLVGLLGVAKARELPVGPRPSAMSSGMQPAREGELPRPADPLEARDGRGYLVVGARRPIDRVDLHTGQGGEVRITHQPLGQRCVIPLLPAVPPGQGVTGGLGALGRHGDI